MFILKHPSVREPNSADIPVKEILSPFVLQRETTWFLSHVEWNRVDMHEGECVLRESNAGREKEEGAMSGCFSLSRLFLWLTHDIDFMEIQTILLSCSTHIAGQAFHSFKERYLYVGLHH